MRDKFRKSTNVLAGDVTRLLSGCLRLLGHVLWYLMSCLILILPLLEFFPFPASA